MISIEDLKRIYQNGQVNLVKYGDPNKPLNTQFFRGVAQHTWKGQHPGGCARHLMVFERHNIIPKYCFSCYKVFIEPRTVIELFKLMVIIEKLNLPNDNSRKCIVEGRGKMRGTYKGFIYCKSLDEGKEILSLVSEIVSKDISKNIPITLKRGCSEYALTYPEYARIEKNNEIMEYREDWQEHEEQADKSMPVYKQPSAPDTHNSPAYTVLDAGTMLAWLRYAATIGDLSYLEISGRPLPGFPDLKRPMPFQAVIDE